MAGGVKSEHRYAAMLHREARDKEREAHIRLTTLARAIKDQIGLKWSEALAIADKHIYGEWRRPGDNGGPLLDD